MTTSLQTQCCIVGGGPAGMMLGYLLGRAGVRTVVLEKHGDFLRDFRGDTVHPSTLRIMQELGLLPAFLKLPHSELRSLGAEVDESQFKLAEFARLAPPANFIALMPQWDFLNFLAAQGRAFPCLDIRMSTEATDLVMAGERVAGIKAKSKDGELEIRADLVVGCDGRTSLIRTKSGLVVNDLGAPIDVLWFRVSRQPGDPEQVLGRMSKNMMLVTIDRNDYWQCAFVINKGGIDQVHSAGLDAFKASIAAIAPHLDNRMGELRSFDDIKLLSVSVDRLDDAWSKPGLLCIGDAAHAMSPVGGVGINLAIQDAVATANLLAAKLAIGSVSDADLDAVRQRRLFPVKVIQGIQVTIHNRVLKPRISGQAKLAAPWPLRLLDKSAWLRQWPARLIGLGVRPEHVQSPQAVRASAAH
jgi:2-polyprenyl-6-methoxyphenol hydroxylase-like FAD-dependent oxidoreductase